MYDDKILWKHLDGELPAAESEAIAAAAGRDEALRARLHGLRTIRAGVLEGAPTPNSGFADRVIARIAKPQTPLFDLDEARRFLRKMVIAAAVLAALGMSYLD